MKVSYRVHAVRRMFERGITGVEVHKVLSEGEEIEVYAEDTPYPDCCSGSDAGAYGALKLRPALRRVHYASTTW
ncbi:MAG: DUF4258 domain-containing protein, partial [Betaproteobacteria bacterium]|nr:DUF4258 domain-containing protein [Betaproteobacteria bacterium]